MLMVCFHILVVYIDIIEIPFLLKDLFCGTCQNQTGFFRTAYCFPCRPTALSCFCRQLILARLISQQFESTAWYLEIFCSLKLKKKGLPNPSYLQATYDTSVFSISMSATFTQKNGLDSGTVPPRPGRETLARQQQQYTADERSKC